MTIEANLESIAQSLTRIAAALENKTAAAPAPVLAAPVVAAPVAPVPPTAAVVPTVPAPVTTAAAPMPPPPTFTPAAPAPAAAAIPFSDAKGLITYVMDAYKAMGAVKGAQIQQVLTGLGYTNINDVKPEHYAQVHAGVEALKAA